MAEKKTTKKSAPKAQAAAAPPRPKSPRNPFRAPTRQRRSGAAPRSYTVAVPAAANASKAVMFKADGSRKAEVDLPAVFQTPLRPDLIHKAVQVARANRRQPYGSRPGAGTRHSQESVGKGKGMSRVPRSVQAQGAVLAPNVVGGRRAHPPQARTDRTLKLNAKERRLAIASALGACANRDVVVARGHRVAGDASLPVLVDDGVSKLEKTHDFLAYLEKIGLAEEVARAQGGVHERPGIGKLRGRRVRVPRSVLVVTGDIAQALSVRKAAGNVPGVDVVDAANLNAELLAPGGDPGRLLMLTESALKTIATKWEA